MPPSGFNNKQSKAIESFLLSCLNELIEESNEKNLHVNVALEKEIKNIEMILENEHTKYQRFILLLVSNYYEKLLQRNVESTNELWKEGNHEIINIRSNILEIHVPEIA